MILYIAITVSNKHKNFENFRYSTRIYQTTKWKNLVSKVLNDYIYSKDILEKIKKYKFVMDKEKQIIMGTITNAYLDYSNYDFIMDLKSTFMDISEQKN